MYTIDSAPEILPYKYKIENNEIAWQDFSQPLDLQLPTCGTVGLKVQDKDNNTSILQIASLPMYGTLYNFTNGQGIIHHLIF